MASKKKPILEMDLLVNMKDAEKQAEGLGSHVVKGLSDAESKLGKMFSDTFKTALEGGMSKSQLAKIEKMHQKSRDKLRKTDAKDLDRRLIEVSREFKVRTRGIEREADRRKQLLQEYNAVVDKTMAEQAENFGESIASAFENLKSGPGGWADIGKKIAQGIQKEGIGLESKGFDKIGKALGGLGKTLMIVAGIGAGLAAIAKIIMEAEGFAKNMNKEFLKGQSALDIMGYSSRDLVQGFDNSGKSLKEELATLRDMATSMQILNKWGVKAEDAQAIFAGFAEGGLLVSEIGDNATESKDKIDKYTESVQAAAVLSKTFGIDVGAMSTDMANYMEEWSMKIGEVKDEFSAVAGAAMDAGFGTKRFYGMLLEATSGASMFNMRMIDAAALLERISEVLSPKMAGELLKRLSEGFKSEGMRDRLQRIMRMGNKEAKAIYAGQAKRDAGEYLASFRDELAGGELGKSLESAGLTVDLSGKPEENQAALIKALQGVDVDQLEEIKLELSKQGKAGKDNARQLDKVWRSAQGATGDETKMVKHMGTWDASATMEAINKSVAGYMGGRTLTEIEKSGSMPDLIHAAEQSGLPPEQWDAFIAFMRRQELTWKDAKDLQGQVAKGQRLSMEEQKKMVDGLGYMVDVDEQGNSLIWKAHLDEKGAIVKDKVINSLQDMMDSNADEMKGMFQDGEVFNELNALTQDIADNTVTMADRIEQGMNWFLNKIWAGIEKLVNFIGEIYEAITSWINPTRVKRSQIEARAGAVGDLQKRKEEYQDISLSEEKKLRKLKIKREKVQDAKEKEKIDAEIADSEKRKKVADEQAKAVNKTLEYAEQNPVTNRTQETAFGEFLGLLRNSLGAEEYKRLGFAGEYGTESVSAEESVTQGVASSEAAWLQKQKEDISGTTGAKALSGIGDFFAPVIADLDKKIADVKSRRDTAQERKTRLGVAGGVKEVLRLVDGGMDVDAAKKIVELGMSAANKSLEKRSDELKKLEEKKKVLEQQQGVWIKNIKTEEEKSNTALKEVNLNLVSLPEEIAAEQERISFMKFLMSAAGGGHSLENARKKSMVFREQWGRLGINADKNPLAGAFMGSIADDYAKYEASKSTTPNLPTPPGGGAQDFLVRLGADGAEVISKFSPQDKLNVFGSRVGGEVDSIGRSAASAAPVKGGGGNVVININGGDSDLVFRTVKRALISAGVVPA